MKLIEKLRTIQAELKVPKSLWNKFGGYSYRSCEAILETLKELQDKHKVCLLLQDEIVNIGDNNYVKSTAILHDLESTEKIECQAYARESNTRKGMDDSQITGATSSYARKYALNGLFLIDDSKDSDTNERRIEADNLAKKESERIAKSVSEKRSEIEKLCMENDINIDKLYENHSTTSGELTEDKAEKIIDIIKRGLEKEKKKQEAVEQDIEPQDSEDA